MRLRGFTGGSRQREHETAPSQFGYPQLQINGLDNEQAEAVPVALVAAGVAALVAGCAYRFCGFGPY